MSKYALKTSVSVSKSKDQIEGLLKRYGATGFATGWSNGYTMVGFQMHARNVRFAFADPQATDRDVAFTASGQRRGPAAAKDFLAQAQRSVWRSVLLMIQAKLEAVDAGIVTWEAEFGPHVVLPDDTTVYTHMTRAIAQAYATGEVRPLLAIGPTDE